jgi:hypothetical protein
MKKKIVKMKMIDVSKDTSKYTGKASELSHQLLIAGIAVVWVVNSVGTNTINVQGKMDYLLWIALILFVIGLSFAIAHYAIAAILSERFYHKNQDKLEESGITDIDNQEVDEPIYIERFTWFCFYTKQLALILGYFFVLINAISKF